MTHLSFHNHRRKPPRLLHYHLRFQFRLSWLHPFHSIGKKLPPDPLDQPLYGCEAETSSDCFSSVPISGYYSFYFGFPVRTQYTLRELIMMSRRRSYMREHNPSVVEGREWKRYKQRLKLL
ncbi:hypothetical protein HID58_046575 [Brassica napus]|uniref:Uncharacterized protein n=1 Tax=Brassica napus TaxID=3708 RepID=A0ABQ8AXK0_BRANA|nr:hypothetical protein HID58_046575 [Brassica napus]